MSGKLKEKCSWHPPKLTYYILCPQQSLPSTMLAAPEKKQGPGIFYPLALDTNFLERTHPFHSITCVTLVSFLLYHLPSSKHATDASIETQSLMSFWQVRPQQYTRSKYWYGLFCIARLIEFQMFAIDSTFLYKNRPTAKTFIQYFAISCYLLEKVHLYIKSCPSSMDKMIDVTRYFSITVARVLSKCQ